MEQVEKISGLILKRLKETGLIVFKADEEVVLERVQEAILADLRAEDALDREVEEILKSHSGELDSGEVDYRKMFRMIKGKLAREREVVL
ncbi:MAG: DUF507 family protein [Thermodesulfobacteriota bacterium]|nr:MAG: DUF507 family protein [Thermodesulfobacteriota bacterium]